MFVDLGLPLNIYLFNQSTARFKGGLGEVRGQGESCEVASFYQGGDGKGLLQVLHNGLEVTAFL